MNDACRGLDAEANADLETMHHDLVALVSRLERSIDDAPTPEAIQAITEQMAEVNARVTTTGSVLFADRSTEIAGLARAVAAALPEVQAAIDDSRRCERLVRSMTAMLATVDDAVRMATKLAP